MIRSILAIIIAVFTIAYSGSAQSLEGVVSIQCDVGTYLSVCIECPKTVNSKAGSYKVATLTENYGVEWETHFRIKRLANGNYTFQTELNTYMAVCAKCIQQGSAQDGIIFNTTIPGKSAQFMVNELPNGKYTIQSVLNNKFIARCEQCVKGSATTRKDMVQVVLVDKSSPASEWEIKKLSPGGRCYAIAINEEIISPPEKPEFEQVLLQTSTAIRGADNAYRVLVGEYDHDGKPDIYILHPSKVGTTALDLSILSGASNYATVIQQATIALDGAAAGNAYDVALGDYDQDSRADLYVMSNTGSKTNLTIYSAASKFGTDIFKTTLKLGAIDSAYCFAIGDDDRDGIPDLFAIKKNHTGTHKTEVHILSGASSYAEFTLHNGTALEQTDKSTEFAVGDYDSDGHPDIYAIKKYGAGAAKTELNILGGEMNYSQFILNTGTSLAAADDSFTFGIGDYNGDGKPDLYAIKKYNTVSKTLEVTILDAQR